MSLSTNITVKDSPTISISAGTDVSFINDGRGVNGVKILVDSSSTNISTRRRITTKLTAPAAALSTKVSAKLARAEVTVSTPFIDVAGKSYNLTDSFQIVYHPESTLAQVQAKRKFLCALIMNGALDNFIEKSIND